MCLQLAAVAVGQADDAMTQAFTVLEAQEETARNQRFSG
jgi:hypothetical protein